MIKRILLGVILFIYIILIFFSACTSLTKKQPHISHVRQMDKIFENYDDNFLPNQNFVFLKKLIYVNEKEERFCESNELNINCSYEEYATGSAIAIDHDKNRLRILTVFHVCGEETFEALDLIYKKENKAKTVTVANEKPKLGETLYTISAPLSMASKTTRFHFHGGFAGCDNQNLTIYDFCYFSIPAAPGSSGSGVFNKYGELVSLISITLGPFPEISAGPRQYFLKKMLKQ